MGQLSHHLLQDRSLSRLTRCLERFGRELPPQVLQQLTRLFPNAFLGSRMVARQTRPPARLMEMSLLGC